jgi:hypothetical protein
MQEEYFLSQNYQKKFAFKQMCFICHIRISILNYKTNKHQNIIFYQKKGRY